MENLQRVDTRKWQQYPVLQALYDDLPAKPYCTPVKGVCYVNPKELAIQEHYIQPNHPAVTRWLCFDIDHPDALFTYYYNNVPIPNLIIVNPENGHAHVCYRLREPVGLIGNSRIKPINYMRAVYYALRHALAADAGYVGNLIKCPFARDMWHVYISGIKDYDLKSLGDMLDLDKLPTTNANDDIFGRNIALFDHTRHIAYPIAHEHNYESLLTYLMDVAREYNSAAFEKPLFDNEVYTTCKSITRYCKSARFNNGNVSQAHREVQSMRGKKGGMKSKRTSVSTSERTTKPWIEQGISQSTYYRRKKKTETVDKDKKTPWESMGISRSTYYRRLKI